MSIASAADLRRRTASLSATVHVSDISPGIVSLDLLAVPAELRHRGCARQALAEVTAWADTHGAAVLLTATPALGAHVGRLIRLYGSFGFTVTASSGLETDMKRLPAPADVLSGPPRTCRS